MNKLGFQNELVWIIDAYLHLKRDQPEKAVPALEELKKSPLFSDTEHKAFQEIIDFAGERKSDAATHAWG